MMRTLVTNLLQNVDGVLHTSGSWLEPEAQKAVLRCYDSRLNKKSFFISMLIPATLSQSDGGPAAAQGDASGKDPVISFMDKVLAEHGSNTVIYLSFGSLFAPFTNPWQLDVFIDTLVEHKRHFVISQASLAPIKTPQLEAKLKAAEEAGLAATSDWVPQNAVLEHPALGVFVTHGGWNSFCESVVQTVPLVMWPFQIDQPLTASMMSECKDPAVWQLYETRGPSLPEYRPTYFQDGPRVSPLGEEIPVPTGTPDALKAELERVLIREAAPGSSELKVRKERMVALRHKYLDSVKRGGEQDQAFAQLLQPVGVRQFLRHAPERPVPALNGQHEAGSNVKSGAAASDGQSHVDADPGFEIIEMRGAKRPREDDMGPNRTGQDPGHSSSAAANASKRKGMPKTIENYVADLPGRVMPPKKLLSRPDFHEQTMREIIYRPETTIQNIVPFDRETLESAFRVSAGEVPGIDPALLEPDQTESSSPRKKRKSKTKHKPNKA
ncbi:hypothetical protein OC861_003435 [Tilletia horrida]|nr:hypothetical protein OC861_003435 [Tilletia horrida]